MAPIVNSSGVVAVNNLWYALAVTVAPRVTGLHGTSGSLLRSLSSAGKATRTILSYYADGNVGVADAYVDATMVEQFPSGTAVPANASIQGLDFGMGVFSVNTNGQGAPMFQLSNRLYFAVTPAWAIAATSNGLNAWDPEASVWLEIDARTVYMSEWMGPSNPMGWSTPTVCVRGDLSGLGLEDLEAIDGLSFTRRGTIDQVTFSTDRMRSAGMRDEILVYQRVSGQTTVSTRPLQVSVGGTAVPISTRYSLDSEDDINAICAWDPENSGNHSSAIGTPEYLVPIFASQELLGVSVVRRETPAAELALSMTGLAVPAGGQGLHTSSSQRPAPRPQVCTATTLRFCSAPTPLHREWSRSKP